MEKLDAYEDVSRSIEEKINDLLTQLTTGEKAGTMFINGPRINNDGSLDDKPAQGIFAFLP